MTDRRTESHHIETISFSWELFRPARATKQFCCAAKPFSAFGADVLKRRMGYQPRNKSGGKPVDRPGDSQMRTFSFILAFAFVIAGSSMAGSVDNLPGIGTFAYTGSPVVPLASNSIIVAAR
jgi:hypothetical protein